MDFLKNLSFSIAIFLIGAIFLLLSLSGGFSAGNFGVTVAETAPRVLAAVVGAVLVAVAVYIEIRVKPDNDQSSPDKEPAREASSPAPEARSPGAQEFFYTLDDPSIASFPVMVKDAVRVQVLGRTAVNLLSQYESVFEKLGQAGCEIQLLFVDPGSEASLFLYGSHNEIYRNNILSAAQHLQRLRSKVGHRLQVRVTRHAPTVSIIVIEKQDMTLGFMQVQLYFLHSAVGRDRPIFKVNYGDRWYGMFRDEFSQLWADCEEWDVAAFLKVAGQDQN